MSKKHKIVVKNKVDAALVREKIYNAYYNKYYNAYMSKYEIEGLNYRQNDFLFRKYWSIGKIAA